MTRAAETKNMALFCDFENIALGVRDADYARFNIAKMFERLLLKGNIVVKKAYCDWARYEEYKAAMHEASFKLIKIPHIRQSGKNSANIRMVVDALDLCYTKGHVDIFCRARRLNGLLQARIQSYTRDSIPAPITHSTSAPGYANTSARVFRHSFACMATLALLLWMAPSLPVCLMTRSAARAAVRSCGSPWQRTTTFPYVRPWSACSGRTNHCADIGCQITSQFAPGRVRPR